MPRHASVVLLGIALLVPDLSAEDKPAPPPDRPYRTCNSPNLTEGEPCVRPPKLIHDVFPEYTTDARRDRVQGAVELMLAVDRDGVPTRVLVTRSLRGDLDQKAVEAVRQWRFEAARYQGKPVGVEFPVEVTFRLR